jgi:hypothetical protein
MSVYASICMHFYQIYVHIHQAVYERISNSTSGSIFVCISNSISCCIFRAHTHGHGAVTVASHSPRRRAVSAPSPRGRYGKFVAQQRKRRQIATFNQIRSARLNSGSQRRLVQARPC